MHPILVVAPVTLLLAAFMACSRDPAPFGAASSGRAGDAIDVLRLEIEPDFGSAGRIERVVRFRVPADQAGTADAGGLVLVRGAVGLAQLRQLASGTLSHAFSERLVPSCVWQEGDVVYLQPRAALDAGATYSLASGLSGLSASVTVAEDVDASALAIRVWPPPGLSGSSSFGVWCGAQDLLPLARAASLEPRGVTGQFRRGAVTDELGRRCVRYRTAEGLPDESVESLVPPPAIEISDGLLLLDPRPLDDDGAAARGEPAVCQPGELAFGPGCASVQDDRLFVRAPDEPLLWAIGGEGLDFVLVTAAAERFVVAPLLPEHHVRVEVGTTDVVGFATRRGFSATTAAPMAHLVLTEVLADPLGPEPHQEWVEIMNDGRAIAVLEDYSLADTSGAEPLPVGVLSPGEYALLVGEDYAADDGVDVPPAPGTRLVRMRRLSADGLKNGGEELRLLGPDGRVVSSVPATPAPKPGRSQARVRPAAPDVPASFALVVPTPGRGNGL